VTSGERGARVNCKGRKKAKEGFHGRKEPEAGVWEQRMVLKPEKSRAQFGALAKRANVGDESKTKQKTGKKNAISVDCYLKEATNHGGGRKAEGKKERLCQESGTAGETTVHRSGKERG